MLPVPPDRCGAVRARLMLLAFFSDIYYSLIFYSIDCLQARQVLGDNFCRCEFPTTTLMNLHIRAVTLLSVF